jgi:hypothetical protein
MPCDEWPVPARSADPRCAAAGRTCGKAPAHSIRDRTMTRFARSARRCAAPIVYLLLGHPEPEAPGLAESAISATQAVAASAESWESPIVWMVLALSSALLALAVSKAISDLFGERDESDDRRAGRSTWSLALRVAHFTAVLRLSRTRSTVSHTTRVRNQSITN